MRVVQPCFFGSRTSRRIFSFRPLDDAGEWYTFLLFGVPILENYLVFFLTPFDSLGIPVPSFAHRGAQVCTFDFPFSVDQLGAVFLAPVMPVVLP